jgi:hypothetical protein
MKSSAFVFVFLASLSCQSILGQSLQEAARKERARRDQLKSSSRIYTNEDLDRYKPTTEDRANPRDASGELTPQRQRLAVETVKLEDHDEATWSRRFFEARSRLQEAGDQEKRLKDRLNELSGGCGPETYYDPYYFSYTRQRLEENQRVLVAARQALADLEEALRRSGNPASWERSKLEAEAGQPAQPEVPQTKNQDYWREQLALIDRDYEAMSKPLQAELFEMVHRRPPAPGEDLTITGGLGICVPQFVIDLDSKIKAQRES